MLVTLGPVAAASARVWIRDARRLLDDVPVEHVLSADVAGTFATYLDTWADVAANEDEFRWEGDISAEQAEYLMHAFFRLAQHLADTLDERGYRYMSPEGDAFYQCLVTSVVDALEHESASSSEFSAHLRSFWPGLFDDP